MSEKKSEAALELTKALIGCSGGIAAAFVTGLFALVALFGQKLPILNGTPIAVPATPTSTLVAPNATFSSIVFAPGIMNPYSNAVPIDAANRYPEGVAQVFGVFSYQGMSNGSPWHYEWYLDGVLQDRLKGGGNWSFGTAGSTWLSTWNPDGVRSGQWELRVYIGDRLAQRGSFVVEQHAQGTPFFSVIRFAEGVQDNKPINEHRPYDLTYNRLDSFKAGTQKVYAFFDAMDVAKNLTWRREWYRDGQLLSDLTKTDTWNADPNQNDWWINIFNDNGLESGTYELKLYISDQLVQLGTFVVDR